MGLFLGLKKAGPVDGLLSGGRKHARTRGRTLLGECSALAGAPRIEAERRTLGEAIPLRFSVVEGKHLGGEWLSGSLVKLSARTGEVLCDEPVAPLSNLKIEIEADTGSPIARELYAKVTGALEKGRRGFCIHVTSLPPELAAWLELQRTASRQ